MNMLHRVEPYVTYRYLNLKSVSELIYKRGYGKVDERTLFDGKTYARRPSKTQTTHTKGQDAFQGCRVYL
ncbi:hypothetical protein QN277_001200 [Acacia crassicarpa]|uniref:Uncharacterized protein n=1 Tax=Acacia crassicarpa TaxID=499986 RepID=A0AAE1N877_9FABA|nr:hypothetical protein QN277_001200 [Acacia crassicarpa]